MENEAKEHKEIVKFLTEAEQKLLSGEFSNEDYIACLLSYKNTKEEFEDVFILAEIVRMLIDILFNRMLNRFIETGKEGINLKERDRLLNAVAAMIEKSMSPIAGLIKATSLNDSSRKEVTVAFISRIYAMSALNMDVVADEKMPFHLNRAKELAWKGHPDAEKGKITRFARSTIIRP